MKSNVLNGGLNFKHAMRRAAGIANDPELIKELVRNVRSKINSVEDGKSLAADIVEKLRTMIRMLRAYIRGEYREIPWKSLILIIGALLYFLVPIDMIPDFIPVTGFADDVAVILLVFKTISDDINAYLLFENDKTVTYND